MVLNTLTTHVGVHVQQIRPQLSLVTNPTLVNQCLGLPQPVTLIVVGQPKTVPYSMWYNIVQTFVPMDPNMYSIHYSRIKEPDPLISIKKKAYAIGVTQSKPMLPVEQLVQNQSIYLLPLDYLSMVIMF